MVGNVTFEGKSLNTFVNAPISLRTYFPADGKNLPGQICRGKRKNEERKPTALSIENLALRLNLISPAALRIHKGPGDHVTCISAISIEAKWRKVAVSEGPI